MRKGCCLAWLVLLFCFGNVLGISVNVPEDVLLYPDQEFYLIMTLGNDGSENAVDIVGYSEGLNVSWNRSVLLLANTGVKIGFVIDPISEIGEHQIIWSVLGEDGEVVGAKTNVLVSTMDGAFGNVIGYYQFELDELKKYGGGDYVDDAQKNVDTAQNLADRGMIFEATKYLDFTRESLEKAIEEESPAKSPSFNWVGLIQTSVFWILVCGVILLGAFVLRRFFYRIKEWVLLRFRMVGKRKVLKSIGGEKSAAQPQYVLDIANMRRKVGMIRSVERKGELLRDLDNCEEKFRLGLPMLGRAYLDRIGRAVKRERV